MAHPATAGAAATAGQVDTTAPAGGDGSISAPFQYIQDGIDNAQPGDVVYVYGYGWPVYRGGPMHYANSLGLDQVVEKLRHYQTQTGDVFWEPSGLLLELADKGQGFS